MITKAEEGMKNLKKKKGERVSLGEIPYKIGNFYLSFNRYEEAINWFKKAHEKDPENWTNLWKLGCAKISYAVLLKERGLMNKAKVFLEEALQHLEMSLKKALSKEEIFQLPAREEIPDLIEQAKSYLREIN